MDTTQLSTPSKTSKPAGGKEQRTPALTRPTDINSQHKWTLAICWILAVVNIWYHTDSDEVPPDPSFGVPERGTRPAGIASKLSKNENEAIIQHDEPEILPEALQPVEFDECCVPKWWGRREPNDMDCFGTCFNERACNDPNYPFNSEEEKLEFAQAELPQTHAGKQRLRVECKNPRQLKPPVEWCQKPSVAAEDEKTAHLVDGIPPAGCSWVSHSGGSGAFQHVLIFPSAKLAFCGIPKVGITQWEQFLRFYMGAKDYPSLPHYKLDRDFFQFDRLDPKVQRRIWEADDWTWAAFIRNPAERLLSSYLDKVKSKQQMKWADNNMTLEDFIDQLSSPYNYTSCDVKGVKGVKGGSTWCSDPHWRPQVFSCGISERLDRFQFIGELHNAADQTRELLEHVGLWQSHGKYFINGGVSVGRNPWCNLKSHEFNASAHVGFQQPADAAQTAYGHSKGAKDKMDKHYTPELLKKVQEELYADDYKLWKLVSANGKKLSKGKELANHLAVASKCRSSWW